MKNINGFIKKTSFNASGISQMRPTEQQAQLVMNMKPESALKQNSHIDDKFVAVKEFDKKESQQENDNNNEEKNNSSVNSRSTNKILILGGVAIIAAIIIYKIIK